MTNQDYLLAVPDGLITRPSGPWVAEKLDYLRRYVKIFETSMRSIWTYRNYIDLFGGPGKNEIKNTHEIVLGSPIISLNTQYPFTGYFFSELNLTCYEALQQRCTASPNYNNVHFYNGDANQIVNTIVKNIKQFFPNSLNLAFLDPEGLELDWSTVAQIGTLRCDLIIHYSQQGLTRNIKTAYQSNIETRVDRFFGTTDWRNIYAPNGKPRKTGLHRELISFYKERLRSLGYQEVKQSDEILAEPLIRNKHSNAPLYRLIFASKHPLGDKFWREITRRDLYGQKQLF